MCVLEDKPRQGNVCVRMFCLHPQISDAELTLLLQLRWITDCSVGSLTFFIFLNSDRIFSPSVCLERINIYRLCARWMRNKSLCDLGPSLRWETPNAGGGDGCDEVNSGELDAMRWGWIGWRRAATILPWNDRQLMDACGERESCEWRNVKIRGAQHPPEQLT